MRIALLILNILLVSACSKNDSDSIAHRPFSARINYDAKFEPVDKVIHGAGQSYDAFYKYSHVLNEETQPLIYMTYLGVNKVNGAQELSSKLKSAKEAFGSIMPQIGLSMTVDGKPQLCYSQEVADGVWDDNIKAICLALKNSGLTIFLRIGYEFNGSWNGYKPTAYKAAWIRIVHALQENEVDNVATVWCFYEDYNKNNDYMSFYPGDELVDWWGIDLFSPRDLSSPITKAYLADAQTHSKPVMVGECTPRYVGVEDGEKSWNSWFEPFFNLVCQNANIKAICYINWNWSSYKQWSDWGNAQIQDNQYVLKNFQQELYSPLFLHNN